MGTGTELSAKRFKYRNKACGGLVPATNTFECDFSDQESLEGARKRVVNDADVLKSKTKIKRTVDAVDHELTVYRNGDSSLNTAVHSIHQGEDEDYQKVTNDLNDEVNNLIISSDQLMTCQKSEAMFRSNESLNLNIGSIYEDVMIQDSRKRKVDVESGTPVRGEAGVLSRLRKECRGVCPLCENEFSTKMLNSHAARCKGNKL